MTWKFKSIFTFSRFLALLASLAVGLDGVSHIHQKVWTHSVKWQLCCQTNFRSRTCSRLLLYNHTGSSVGCFRGKDGAWRVGILAEVHRDCYLSATERLQPIRWSLLWTLLSAALEIWSVSAARTRRSELVGLVAWETWEKKAWLAVGTPTGSKIESSIKHDGVEGKMITYIGVQLIKTLFLFQGCNSDRCLYVGEILPIARYRSSADIRGRILGGESKFSNNFCLSWNNLKFFFHFSFFPNLTGRVLPAFSTRISSVLTFSHRSLTLTFNSNLSHIPSWNFHGLLRWLKIPPTSWASTAMDRIY